MRLFLYYTSHAFINQVKKLCKSWFLIFILACFVLGGVIGGVIGYLFEEVFPEEPGYGDVPGDELPPDELPPDELPPDDGDIFEEISPEKLISGFDAIASAVIIAMLLFSSVAADKSGGAIFMMADVNLLFQAPMKPQSVLFFKLMTQILLMVFSSLYIVIEIPILSSALGFGALGALMIVLAWLMLFAYSKLLNVLIYTVTSTHEGLKKYIRPACLVIAASVLLPIGIDYSANKGSFFASAENYLTLPFMRYLPVFGWLKSMMLFALEGNYLASLGFFALSALGIVLAVFGIWHIKADFYESAMQKSEDMAAAMRAAEAGGAAQRKKDRGDRLRRDGMSYGGGANMFFFKSVYNRLRFAYFKVFTKTGIFYLVILVGLAAILRFAAGIDSFIAVGIVAAVMVFFRSLGNPLAHDMDKPYLVTVPASAHEKVLWSLLGGTVDTALDTLPALLISGILMSASPWLILAFWLLSVAVDFYANNVMLFIELSLPSSISNQLKQMVVVLFIYFGLIPIAAAALISYLILYSWVATLLISSLAALAIAFIFFAFSPLFLSHGRK